MAEVGREMRALLSRGRAHLRAGFRPQELPPIRPSSPLDLRGLSLLHLSLLTEEGERCALCLVREATAAAARLRPVLVLHGTNASKTQLLESGWLQRLARQGVLAVGVDSRHHGERMKPPNLSYWPALVRAWRRDEPSPMDAADTAPAEALRAHPFMYDTVWDLMRVLDYLASRDDVDTSRVGATGISLGGMHAWLWAAADPRVSAVCPAIGVQSFGYAIAHDAWHARAASLAPLMDAAAADAGRPLDGGVVAAVWAKLLPYLSTHFDAPYSLAAIAPRPCLIVNSASDPRCPRQGVEQAVRQASAKWRGPGSDNLALYLDTSNGEQPLPADQWKRGHVITPAMYAAIDLFLTHTIVHAHDSLPPNLPTDSCSILIPYADSASSSGGERDGSAGGGQDGS
ncbi:hypothetical protein AB1Y20_006412 [Prymnesium parvum]|uniref:Dienelactone hydrolase domain-containing protein n=1 Tax=Prymnesium parvum TaxID=97485 RepID=A0AB34J406_PRYPA